MCHHVPHGVNAEAKLLSRPAADTDVQQVGSVPQEICDLRRTSGVLQELIVDCLGPKPEVTCSCCTRCCRGLPDPKCIDVESGKEVY